MVGLGLCPSKSFCPFATILIQTVLNREPLPLDTVSRLLTFLEKLTRELAGAGPRGPAWPIRKGQRS